MGLQGIRQIPIYGSYLEPNWLLDSKAARAVILLEYDNKNNIVSNFLLLASLSQILVMDLFPPYISCFSEIDLDEFSVANVKYKQ